MDHPFKSPVVLSFCPGILGIERGLERAGVKCRIAAYVEIEAFIIANLVAGMEAGVLDPAPIWTDAKTFDARPFRGKVHGIIGGYPCPGESLAGLREGHLYKGFIWPAIRRAVAAARPLFCFFENVDDHLTGTYPIVQRSLRNMGYAVEAGIFTAEEAGAPHERGRLFILAVDHTYGSEQSARRADNEEVLKLPKRKWANKCAALLSRTSKELANTTRISEREQADQPLTIPVEGRTRDEFSNGGQLADSLSQGLEVGEKQSTRQKCQAVERSCFPAGQGSQQFDWEQPRTAEPKMGCTINGYNFREDLLRAIGNSVVEQTAELAFIDLMKKHFA